MLDSKPYTFRYIRSLRVDVSMEMVSWIPGEATFILHTVMSDPDCVNHQEFTKFLLKMTRASRLEELVVKRNKRGLEDLRCVGRDIMMGLLAVRFMPSLRRLQLINLAHPPTALVVGYLGIDKLDKLSVTGGHFDVEKSEVDWKGLRIPEDGPLSTSFKEAFVDWKSILRIHSQLSAFDIKETPLFPAVTHLHLDPMRLFYQRFLEQVQDRMGGRQPTFRKLKVLHYRSFSPSALFPTWDNESDPLFPGSRLKKIADECSTVQKLIVDIMIDLLEYGELHHYRTKSID